MDKHPLKEPQDVVPEILLEMEYYTEGPVVGEAGEFYFTDLVGQGIYVFRNGICSKWGGGLQPNGQAILQDGRHLVCDSQRGIVMYEKDGKEIKMLSPEYIEELAVRCPNDIAIDQNNGFYFTDSVRKEGAVFFVDWNGKGKVIARNIDYANGIVFHSREQFLYVAESYGNRILKIDLKEETASSGYRKVLITLPYNKVNPETGNLPDGLAMDEHGRLWIAHYGMQAVHVISAEGELLTSYNCGIPLCSNICFVNDEVWVTGGSGEPGPGMVCRLKVGVKGMSLND